MSARLDKPEATAKLPVMSHPPAIYGTGPTRDVNYERKVRIVKTVVLALACVVGLTLVMAVVFGVYHHVTDRPAKELFGSPPPSAVDARP